MAKWGEGDPRWIVEERPDATNVNNWHWTEKNATHWSKERLKTLLEGFKIDQNGSGANCTFNVDKISGEATANNRKGKLIFFYEWDIILKWSGRLPGNKIEFTGKAIIPNLSEENDIDDIEVTITIDKSNPESDQLKTFLYNVGRFKIRELLAIYIKELKEEYSKDLILPKKEDGQVKPRKPDVVTNISSGFNKKINLGIISSTPSVEQNSKVNVDKLEIQTTFQCSPEDLYNAFTKIEMASAFTGGSVKLNPTKGGEFVFFGGNVYGEFIELIPNKKIVQSWRLKQWPTGHFSNVTIKIEDNGEGTSLHITQKNVPVDELNKTRENWKRFYCNGIKQAFGFGSTLTFT